MIITLLAATGLSAWSVIFFIAGAAFLIFSLIYGALHASPGAPGFWGRTDLGIALIIVAIALKVIFEV